MGDPYLWLKSLHVVAVIAWMAGMLYLPRLFVYHADAKPGSELSETLKVMERRLLRAIVNPAMIAVWGLGLAMAWMAGWWLQGWFLAKLVLVGALTIVHHMFAAWRKQFERDANTRPARFYRIWNEVPTLLMIAIVVLVIFKPF
ncbi:MAG: protoporphyrinogen oxidase HemJ [Alphaproteobacteria bacterium]|nr:protoporphyrinogen oxidase HemJ [Alphaproteobacteria bacterium]